MGNSNSDAWPWNINIKIIAECQVVVVVVFLLLFAQNDFIFMNSTDLWKKKKSKICTTLVFLIGIDPSGSAAPITAPESEGPSVHSKPTVFAL